MKFLWNDPDGGHESNGRMWGLEIKSLFSVLLLSFTGPSRDAYHEHAFNSISWLLWGKLNEIPYTGKTRVHTPSWRPIFTYRLTFHQVHSYHGRSWALTFRGPWINRWREFLSNQKRFVTLTHGRKEVSK